MEGKSSRNRAPGGEGRGGTQGRPSAPGRTGGLAEAVEETKLFQR